jgi:hypothetical protein
MSGAIPLLPKYAFMAWCLVKHRDNFTFILMDIETEEGSLHITNMERVNSR